MPLVTAGRIDPEDSSRHRMGLSQAAEAYGTFEARADGVLKVLLDPAR